MQELYDHYSFLDIGNTTVVLKKYSPSTKTFYKGRRFLTNGFKPSFLAPYLKNTEKIFVSNVVSELLEPLKEFFLSQSIKSFFVEDVEKHQVVLNAKHTGADIIAQIEGANSFIKKPFCVVSMGTAITITKVDKDGVFKGGLIAADYKMQLKALSQFTSKLPYIPAHIKDEDKKIFSSLETISAIKSGSYHLIYFGIQGIIRELKKQDENLTVIATGGFSTHFRDLFDDYHEDLIFIGLVNLFKNEIGVEK